MPEWLLVAIGMIVGIVALSTVYYIASSPRPLRRRSRLARRSGDMDDPTKHWPGGPYSDP